MKGKERAFAWIAGVLVFAAMTIGCVATVRAVAHEIAEDKREHEGVCEEMGAVADTDTLLVGKVTIIRRYCEVPNINGGIDRVRVN